MREGDKERESMRQVLLQTPQGSSGSNGRVLFTLLDWGGGQRDKLSFPKRATIILPPRPPCSFTM